MMKRAASATKKVSQPGREQRVIQSPFSFRTTRTKSGKDQRTISGLAIVWSPARSSNLGGFVEEIAPTAFDKNLKSKPDVVALWNHDPSYPLARTTSGTLRLNKTKRGLAYEFDAGDQTYTQDLIKSMERGDVSQSSFGFFCLNDSWREDPSTGVIVRTVLEAELFDVSPVTFPAYPDATSAVRSKNLSADLKAKLKAKRDEDDCDDDEQDDDGNCPCEDDYDGDEDCDDYRKRKRDADIDPEDDPCSDEYTGDDDCDDDDDNEEEASRAAQIDLLLRRLR